LDYGKLMALRATMLLIIVLPLAGRAVGQTVAENDTIYRVDLSNHDVAGSRKWENDTVRYRYNQMKYYVTTILPYLKEATELFNELNTKLNDPSISGKQRREYVRSKESFVRVRFEEKIKSLNETQGVLLIKLAARQTGLNIYQQLADFKGAIPAMKWQAWARIHGFNLNRKYHPEDEPDLERIMRSLGYALPEHYGTGVKEY
jgi:hypothetical protein